MCFIKEWVKGGGRQLALRVFKLAVYIKMGPRY
jgi:hypothetical protein